VVFDASRKKHAVYDAQGQLHGLRRTLEDARALAGNIKPPTKP
jgi:hypothetical protein